MKKQTYVKPDVEMFEAEVDNILEGSNQTNPEEMDDHTNSKFGHAKAGFDSSPIFSESSASFGEMDASTGPF